MAQRLLQPHSSLPNGGRLCDELFRYFWMPFLYCVWFAELYKAVLCIFFPVFLNTRGPPFLSSSRPYYFDRCSFSSLRPLPRPRPPLLIRLQLNSTYNPPPLSSTSHLLSSIQSSPVQPSPIHLCSVEFSSVPFSLVHFSSVHLSSVQSRLVQFTLVQSSPVLFSSPQFSSVQ